MKLFKRLSMTDCLKTLMSLILLHFLKKPGYDNKITEIRQLVLLA